MDTQQNDTNLFGGMSLNQSVQLETEQKEQTNMFGGMSMTQNEKPDKEQP